MCFCGVAVARAWVIDGLAIVTLIGQGGGSRGAVELTDYSGTRAETSLNVE
jgi:hypothetical protein